MTMTPEQKIINMRDYGNKCPDWAFRMDRLTPYGNRFLIGKHGTREEVVRAHKTWLRKTRQGQAVLKRFIEEWDGVSPCACWCVPELCHVGNFLEVADEF